MIMKESDINLAKILTYAGTLPLIACVLSGIGPVPGFDRSLVAQTYSAVIISFLCGIHWAAFLFFPEKCPRYFLISSNVVALLAWGTLLISYEVIARFLPPLCFLFLFALDSQLRMKAIIPNWFYTLRRNATAIVVLSLLALAWL
jgi:hypothetical protein